MQSFSSFRQSHLARAFSRWVILPGALGVFASHLSAASNPAEPQKSQEASFSQSSESVECYDFVEVTLRMPKPSGQNPFTNAVMSGRFGLTNSSPFRVVEGFCDSEDGTVHRIRFMPRQPGAYAYSISFRQGDLATTHSGSFVAIDKKRRGLIRPDPKYRWH